MSNDETRKFQEQLDEWQGKLDQLKVRGNLFKMEYRDKQDEVFSSISSAYDDAKSKFADWTEAGAAEADRVGTGFKAAWSAFKDAYKNATED
ncbi:MAG: sll1863 family stress response protein [Planctomycetota bacterium]|jgi:hypothetical protein